MKAQHLKAAVNGTNDYHTLMRQTIKADLFRRAGYIAPVIAEIIPEFPTVNDIYSLHATELMQQLAYATDLPKCNPRIPYLLIAWILVGADNPYRCSQYVENDHVMWLMAHIHLSIAFGNVPDKTTLKKYAIEADALAAGTGDEPSLLAYDAALHAAKVAYYNTRPAQLWSAAAIYLKATSAAYYEFGQGHGDKAEIIIKKQSQNWQYLSDELALSFAREVVTNSTWASKTPSNLWWRECEHTEGQHALNLPHLLYKFVTINRNAR